MAGFCWSFTVVLMMTCTTCFSMFPHHKIDTLPAVLPSVEIYSETPCEMHSLSAWKDIHGNLWGVGDDSLWWFNKTNLSWSLLPLPNGTYASGGWRVSCSDSSSYIALQNFFGGTLVLHLPWLHWQMVHTDEVQSTIDGNASWCDMRNLYSTDMARKALYILDHEEARWVIKFEMKKANDGHSSFFGGTSRTWLKPDRQLLLFEQKLKHSQLIIVNVTGITWTLIGRSEKNTWPQLSDQFITWMQGMDKIWLWQSDRHGAELWVFEMIKSTWKKIINNPIDEIQHSSIVLTSWINGNEICFLCRERSCTSQYSASHTKCWNFNEYNAVIIPRQYNSNKKYEKSNITPFTLSSKVISGLKIQKGASPSNVLLPSVPEKKTWVNKNIRETSHLLHLALPSHSDAFELNSQEISVTAAIPEANTPWNQQHSNIFGSVIFFGTSIAIFSIVGLFWCLRRCVHFPKEALLLRDPPSVRYTAIPDSSATCESRGKPKTYSMIPDFIA